MGFKCRVCNVLGGSEDFPTGSAKALRRQRAEVLIKKCAQCLLDCDCGWTLDTSRCPTINDFINIKNLSTSYLDAPGLLFINSISGCKLLMFYEPNNMGTKNYNNSSSFIFSINTYHSGLCCSMIPGGSSSVFGDPTTETFYPNDATRVCGTYYRSGSSSDNAPAAYSPRSGIYYAYFIMATPDCVMFGANHGDSETHNYPAVPIYATGRLFGSLLNENDTSPQAKYGTLVFRKETTGYEQWVSIAGFPIDALISSGSSYNGFGVIKNAADSRNYICFTDTAGNWLNTLSSYDFSNFYFPLSWIMLSQNVFAQTAWSAFVAVRAATDLSTNGVVTGIGMKGFLETDYFRAVGNGNFAQTFDNKKFYYAEANLGLVIGWDPSNNE